MAVSYGSYLPIHWHGKAGWVESSGSGFGSYTHQRRTACTYKSVDGNGESYTYDGATTAVGTIKTSKSRTVDKYGWSETVGYTGWSYDNQQTDTAEVEDVVGCESPQAHAYNTPLFERLDSVSYANHNTTINHTAPSINSGVSYDIKTRSYSGSVASTREETIDVPSILSTATTYLDSAGAQQTRSQMLGCTIVTSTVSGNITTHNTVTDKTDTVRSLSYSSEQVGTIDRAWGRFCLVHQIDDDEVLFAPKDGLALGTYTHWTDAFDVVYGPGSYSQTWLPPNKTWMLAGPKTNEQGAGTWETVLPVTYQTSTYSVGDYYSYGFYGYTFTYGYQFTYTVIPLTIWTHESVNSSLVTTTTADEFIFPPITKHTLAYGVHYHYDTIQKTTNMLAVSTMTSAYVSYSTATTQTTNSNGVATTTKTGVPLGRVTLTQHYITSSTRTFESVKYNYNSIPSGESHYNVGLTGKTTLMSQWLGNSNGYEPFLHRPAKPAGLVGFGGNTAEGAPIYFTIKTVSAGTTFTSDNTVSVDFTKLGQRTGMDGGRLVVTSCDDVFDPAESRTTAWSVPASTTHFSTATTVLATFSSTTQTSTITVNSTGGTANATTSTRTDRHATYAFSCTNEITGDFVQMNTTVQPYSPGVNRIYPFGNIAGLYKEFIFGRSEKPVHGPCTLFCYPGVYSMAHYSSFGAGAIPTKTTNFVVTAGISSSQITNKHDVVCMVSRPLLIVESIYEDAGTGSYVKFVNVEKKSFSAIPNMGTGGFF